MTKKDYEVIAKIIKDVAEAKNGTPVESLFSILTARLANYLETTNPRFDRERFIAACTSD